MNRSACVKDESQVGQGMFCCASARLDGSGREKVIFLQARSFINPRKGVSTDVWKPHTKHLSSPHSLVCFLLMKQSRFYASVKEFNLIVAAKSELTRQTSTGATGHFRNHHHPKFAQFCIFQWEIDQRTFVFITLVFHQINNC